jgi:hypothetical protein
MQKEGSEIIGCNNFRGLKILDEVRQKAELAA